MLFNIGIKHGGPYLLVIGSGRARLCDLLALVDVAARVASARQDRRVLVDMLSTIPELSFTEHLQLGTHAAAALSTMEKVASVVDVRYRTGTSEKAAQKAGVALRTFTDLQAAELWLMGDDTGDKP